MIDPWKDEDTKPDMEAETRARDADTRARDRERQIREERQRELAIELMKRMHLKTFAEALAIVQNSGGDA